MNSIPHQVKKRPIDDPHPTSKVKDAINGEVVSVHQEQITSSIEHTQFFNFQPQGSQTVLRLTPAQIDFTVSSSALAEIKFVALQMPITNGHTGAALELVPAPWFFNQIQILINNQIVEQMWPEGIFQDIKYLTDEQVSLYAAMAGNMSAASLTERDVVGAAVTANNIAANSSKEIWLILPATFLQQTKCPLNSIVNLNNNSVTFRFFFNTFGQIVSSGSAMTDASQMTVGNMLLWLGGTSIGKNDSLPFDGPHSYTFRQHERAITTIGSVSANGRISQTLVNFNGLFSQVVAYPREQGANQEKVFQCHFSGTGATGSATGPYLPSEWTVYNSTLYDSSNQPYSAVNLPYNLQALAPDFIYDNSNIRARSSTFPTKFPYMEWNLDGEPWESHYDGRLGGLNLNNNWQIVTYINPSFTTKNVELVILGDRLTELKIDPVAGIVVGVPLN